MDLQLLFLRIAIGFGCAGVAGLAFDLLHRRRIRTGLHGDVARSNSKSKEDREKFIDGWVMRVYTNRRNAHCMLVLVGCAMVFGIVLFIHASQTIDHSDLRILGDRMRSVSVEMEEFGEAQGPSFYAVRDSLWRYTGGGHGVGHRPDLSHMTPQTQALADSLYDKQERILAHTQQLVRDFDEAGHLVLGMSEESYKNRALDAITLAVLRLGIIVILIYACQIMLRAYRYFLRTADHYTALLDALVLSGLNGLSMQEAFELVRSHVDVGREPNPPTEKLIDGATSLVTKSR